MKRLAALAFWINAYVFLFLPFLCALGVPTGI